MSPVAQRYVVIVDPYSSGSLFAREFESSGCKVIAVLSSVEPPDVYAASYRPSDFERVCVADSEDLGPLLDTLRNYLPLCVLAGCESGVELAEQLAPLLVPECANTVDLAAARRDKGVMAQAAVESGVAMMKQICTDDFSLVQDWLLRNGLAGRSLVVKPPKSASTDGVVRVDDESGLKQAFDALLGQPNRLGIINDRVLIQEYLSGTEYVVDTFSHGGTHTLCSVCKYTKLEHATGMAIYDRMDWVSPEDAVVEPLMDYAQEVLNALGIHWGNAHIEIMQTRDGLRLVEVGARPHGGGHPRLCFQATGDSQIHRSVNYFAHSIVPGRRYTLLKNMTVVFFRALAPSVVRGVARLHALAQLSSCLDTSIQVQDQQAVPATRDLFATLALGFVVLAHSDPRQLEKDVIAVRQAEKAVFQSLEQGAA